MKKSTLFMSVLSFTMASLASFAGESGRAGATPAELKPKLDASRARWEEAKRASGGNYEYTARFQSFTGFGWECTVVVRNNQVVERRHATFSRMPNPEAPSETWTERGEALGQHREGVPPRTMDEIYDEAARVLQQPPMRPARWLYQEDGAGLLLVCGWMDEMIADDAPLNGIRLAEIHMRGPDPKP